MSRFRRLLSTAVTLALVANALDLSTSALPTQIDGDMPSRSLLALSLQCALLAVLTWRARRTPMGWLRRLRALPVPRPAACLLFTFVAVELAHVALRMEIYPFSSVAMFSSLAPCSQAQPTYEADAYVFDRNGDLEIFSLLREGNPLFARHFDWDYKAAWLMLMYKGSPQVDAILTERLRAEGLPPPSLRHMRFYKRDGRLVRIARNP